jgi:hypothetical protein
MLNQADTLVDIWSLIINPQAGSILRKPERGPNTLIRLGCGHVPFEVQNHHFVVRFYSADEMHLTFSQRHSCGKTGFGNCWAQHERRMQICWAVPVERIVMFTEAIRLKESSRMLLNRLPIGQIDLVPHVFGVVLVKTLDIPIALWMSDG